MNRNHYFGLANLFIAGIGVKVERTNQDSKEAWFKVLKTSYMKGLQK